MEEMKGWIDEQNIIVRDFFRLVSFFFCIVFIILYPILCWFYDRSEIIDSIKSAWKGFDDND